MTTGLIWGGSALAVLGNQYGCGRNRGDWLGLCSYWGHSLARITCSEPGARRITSREIVEYVTFPSSVRPSLIGMGPVRTAVQRRIR